MAGSPKAHGPHCPADWPASHLVILATSARGHEVDGRGAMTPQPSDAPARARSATPRRTDAAVAGRSHVPK